MFYDDFTVGDVFTTETFTLSAEQIIAFAETYDPQPFHTDAAAAAASIYGGLIASGWHVFAVAFGAVVRLGLFKDGGQGTNRLEDVYWMHPVRPGDTLQCRVKITDKRLSQSRAERGYVRMQFTIKNQNNQNVAGFCCDEITLRRPA